MVDSKGGLSRRSSIGSDRATFRSGNYLGGNWSAFLLVPHVRMYGKQDGKCLGEFKLTNLHKGPISSRCLIHGCACQPALRLRCASFLQFRLLQSPKAPFGRFWAQLEARVEILKILNG